MAACCRLKEKDILQELSGSADGAEGEDSITTHNEGLIYFSKEMAKGAFVMV